MSLISDKFDVISLTLLWLAVNLWTLYRLGSGKMQRDKFVFKAGVKQFGITVWLATTVAASYLASQERPNHGLVYYAVIFGFFLLPICLWMGVVWGKAMAYLFPNH